MNDTFDADMDASPNQIGGGFEQASFMSYMTSFSSKEQSQLLNLLQYGGLSIIPILTLLKIMKIYLPNEPSQLKPTTELIIEVVLQLTIIIVAFFFIHKLVVYLPTYSQEGYDSYSLMSGILPLFFLMFTLDTKISEKLNTLFDRLLNILGVIKEPYCGGNQSSENHNKNNNDYIAEPVTIPLPQIQPPLQQPQQPEQPEQVRQQNTFTDSMSGSDGGYAPF